ncbi:MAG: lipopolysaccharide biosynthesis protein [Chloroflexota bacterium]|nr:lipopolysaccharide biosynthesis protein [Chloroflexota bacterium]
MSRRLFRDITKYAPGLVLSIVLGAGSTAIFARLASPEDLGTYLLLFALATSVSAPLGLWLAQAALRLLPAYVRDGRPGKFLHALFLLELALGGLATLLVGGVLWLGFGGRYFQGAYLLPAAVTTFFSVIVAVQGAILQATFASGRWSIYATLGSLAKLLLSVALFPILGAVSALLWGAAIATVGVWLVREVQQRRELPMDSSVGMLELRQMWTEMTSFGTPFALAGIGEQVLTFSDRYIIGALLGPAAVALYSTNYSIAEKLFALIQAPLIYASGPHLNTHWEHGAAAEAERLIRTAMRWLFMIGVAILAFTIVRSRLLSALVLGDSLAEGHLVIPIVTASILVWAASQYGHASFQLGKISWIIAATLLIAAVANTLAVLWLTATIGYLGGALGTGAGYLVYAILVFVVSRLRGPLPWRIPWLTLAHVVCGAAAAVVFWATIVPERLTSFGDLAAALLGGGLGLLAYVLLLVAFGELPSNLRMADLKFGRGRA